MIKAVRRMARMTLVYPIRITNNIPEVLLGKKTRGIGAGKWNGWGGKVKDMQGLAETALRELKEESGLRAIDKDLRFKGMLHFQNEEIYAVVYAFLLYRWKGKVKVNKEMTEPTWFPLTELPPPAEFLPADQYFLRFLLSGKSKIIFRASYGPKQEYLTKIPEVEFVESLLSKLSSLRFKT